MKKITLLVATVLMSLGVNAQITLTGTDSPDTITGGVFCAAGNIQDLDAFRSYVLTDFGVTGDFQINTIQYGASPGSVAGAPAVGLTVTITVYTTDAPFPTGTLTEIATTTDVLFDGDGGVVRDVALDALIPAGSEVVILTAYPNDGITNVAIGSGGNNVAGNVSWLRSFDCLGDTNIIDIDASFGLTNAWVINAIGDEILSVEDNNLAGVSVYPNPVNDVLNVKLPLGADVNTAKLYDVLGRDTGLNMANGTFNTSGLSNGIYMIVLETTEGNYTSKVVKQ